MKTIKKEITVTACDLCGRELGETPKPFRALKPSVPEIDRGVEVGMAEPAVEYSFHPRCAEKALIELADKS